MSTDAKLAQMGTHQYTRGVPGHPAKRINTKAPRIVIETQTVEDENGTRKVDVEVARPGAGHPRQGRLDERQKAYDDNVKNHHAGVHRPGAIHSRGGRA